MSVGLIGKVGTQSCGLGLRWAGITAFECILARIQVDPEMLENAFPMQKSLKIQMH